MNQDILNYISEQRVGVLAVEMLDGSVHAATLHVAHIIEPFTLLFGTTDKSRKAEMIVKSRKTRAAFVFGTDESTMKTFQLNGIVEKVPDAEREAYAKTYLGKFPEKKERYDNPHFLALKFTPTWWRFSMPGQPAITS